MTDQIKNLLKHSGYLVHKTDNRILIRRKLWVNGQNIFKLFLPGMLLILIAIGLRNSTYPIIAIFFFGSGLVLMFAPFLNYMTSAYRSLSIDLQNRSLLFRSSFARAYRFTDIVSLNLEIVNKSIKNQTESTPQDYVLSLLFENNAKEELLFLSIGPEQSEQVVFQLKDYFQVLFSI